MPSIKAIDNFVTDENQCHKFNFNALTITRTINHIGINSKKLGIYYIVRLVLIIDFLVYTNYIGIAQFLI